MKKLFTAFSVIMITLLCAISAFAAEADDSGKWEYQTYGSGVELIKYNGTETDVYVPSKIELDGISFSVVKLGDELFKNNTSLNSATLGEGITEIGASAFVNATNLVCIVTPESLTTIGANAFSGCVAFNSVILYDTVTSIGGNAFEECANLTVYCNENSVAHTYALNKNIKYVLLGTITTPEIVIVDEIEYYVQDGQAIAISCKDSTISDITVPSHINGYPVTILRGTFRQCGKLEKISLPNTVLSIENGAFWRCDHLKEINIPKGVTTIGDSMFMHCWALENIEIPDNVKKIESYAFYGCINLAEIVIPDTVVEIGSNAFGGCSELTQIIIPDTVNIIENNVFEKCTSLSSVYIGKGVTTIGNSAFKECVGLTNITIPNSVETIDDYAFHGCTNLTNISFVENLTKIGNNAFFECIKLLNVSIPESVTNLSIYSFEDTTVLCVIENSFAHTFAKENNLLYFIENNGEKPEIYTQDGISYFIYNNEACAIHFDDSVKDVIIPETIDNCPITDVRSTFSRSSITSITLPKGVTAIPDSAFRSCKQLVEATLPDGVILIGISAFNGCQSLTKINIPDGVTRIEQQAFSYCEKLKDISIPVNTTYIGSSAFSHCEALTDIIIPQNVEQVCSSAFSGCTSIENVRISSGVKRIDSSAFQDCINIESVKIPSSVTLIYKNSFPDTVIWIVENNSRAYKVAKDNDLIYFITSNGEEPEIYVTNGVKYFIQNEEAIAVSFDNSTTQVLIPEEVNGYPVTTLLGTFRDDDVINVSLPNGLKVIGNYAFANTDITSIEIPKTVTSIGAWAFKSCSAIESIDIPYGVSEIGHSAFYACTSLSNITMPNSVTDIGGQTFWGCSMLVDITLPDSITTIPSTMFIYCNNLRNVTIPDSVTEIGSQAFYRCYSLKEITLPHSVTKIGWDAFYDCQSLENILIPDGVTTIYSDVFADCWSLTNVIIPDSVTTIQETAFSGCSDLRTIIVPKSVTSMKTSSFPSRTILCVYKDSYAHTFAVDNNLLYFVIRETDNPEISYGSGISGTATYTDSSVASNIAVEMLYDDGMVKETVITDADGSYEFTYAEVGRYTIRVTDASGNTASEIVSVKRMNVFDVYLAGDTNLVLKKGYTVSGTVSPENATVTLADADGNVISSVETTDGTFAFSNIPNGTYILKAETENGTVVKEITVFNADITSEALIVEVTSATITGYVEVEDREFNHHKRAWVEVTIYNEEGIAVDSQKTDTDGNYTFTNLPLGDYSIVAETNEMRPDKHKHFNRSHKLTGYAYVEVTEAKTYDNINIVLYEENEYTATISGKVTAQGETQDCEVILTNVFKHEIAKCKTGKNGKYSFKNIPDGLYFITAITNSNGMGYAVVVVHNGKVYGETDITVRKSDRVHNHEEKMHNEIPECHTREEALKHKDKIAEHKRFYDSLPEKEKKQFSKEYVNRLNKLAELIADASYDKPDGVEIENGGTVISGDELDSEEKIEFVLNICETSEHEITDDGIKTKEDFEQQEINDKAKDKHIAKYYDITLTKNGKEISNVHKHTDTTGKLRITMDIPEEHRGHKHYSFVHMHNGEATTLVDLDDDPNTVTFEVDKFSTFALAYSDVELTETYSANITYDAETGKISVSSTESGKLYIATYNGTTVENVQSFAVNANSPAQDYDLSANQAAFIWDEHLKPLCEKFTIGN